MLSYYAVPNVHQSTVVSTRPILEPVSLSVLSHASFVIPKNVTIIQGGQNELRLNVTVTSQSGQQSSLKLQVFARTSTSCTYATPSAFLLDEEVNSSTLTARLDADDVYCFVFDNENYSTDKIVSVTASLYTRSDVKSVANDGMINMAGLGVGAFGFIIVFIGASRKTVIPWD